MKHSRAFYDNYEGSAVYQGSVSVSSSSTTDKTGVRYRETDSSTWQITHVNPSLCSLCVSHYHITALDLIGMSAIFVLAPRKQVVGKLRPM